MTTSRTALTPAAVGSRMAAITAVVAAAVMFGAGLLAGRFVMVTAGVDGGAASLVPLAVGALAAGYSAQGSARRMLRARARRAAAGATA